MHVARTRASIPMGIAPTAIAATTGQERLVKIPHADTSPSRAGGKGHFVHSTFFDEYFVSVGGGGRGKLAGASQYGGGDATAATACDGR